MKRVLSNLGGPQAGSVKQYNKLGYKVIQLFCTVNAVRQ